MMELYFATNNKHKLEEAEAVLSKYNIKVKKIDAEKIEVKEHTIEETSANNAKRIANEIKKPVIVEDTGVFFEAYRNFPGAHPRMMFETLGYKGLLKLLDREIRNAYFKTAIAYCEPKKEPKLFVDELHGEIAKKVLETEKDIMPYEKIFVCKEFNKYLGELTREEKNTISHRAKAFSKLGKYLSEKYG